VGQTRPGASACISHTVACPPLRSRVQAIIHAVKTMGDDGSGSYSNIIAGHFGGCCAEEVCAPCMVLAYMPLA